MKRWSNKACAEVEEPKVDAFLAEISEVCRRHNMSISHEDSHGAFVIESGNPEENLRWLSFAHLGDSFKAE